MPAKLPALPRATRELARERLDEIDALLCSQITLVSPYMGQGYADRVARFERKLSALTAAFDKTTSQ